MESPQLYDSADYNKKGRSSSVKVKSGNLLYPGDEVDYGDLAELSTPEISLNLENIITDSQFNEGLIQDIQGLTVDKNSAGHRNLGVNNMYNPLHYLPQPVHGATQFERQYQQDRLHMERPHIKEEPHDGQIETAQHEYSACARVGPAVPSAAGGGYGTPYGGGGGGGGGGGEPHTYTNMTPTTVPGADGLCRSPLKSPTGGKMIAGCKKILDKGSDEYKRRRERNNIAVRKSREKAKARTRETEERVKKLIIDNERLHKKCEILSNELAAFHTMFANVHSLPEHVQRDLRKQMEAFNQQKQHLLNM